MNSSKLWKARLQHVAHIYVIDHCHPGEGQPNEERPWWVDRVRALFTMLAEKVSLRQAKLRPGPPTVQAILEWSTVAILKAVVIRTLLDNSVSLMESMVSSFDAQTAQLQAMTKEPGCRGGKHDANETGRERIVAKRVSGGFFFGNFFCAPCHT